MQGWEGFAKIVVTGCQRSGTTILTKMIATDLQYTKLDEFQIYPHDLRRLHDALSDHPNVVIHSPQLTAQLHQIDIPDTCVVWIHRCPKAIRASMQRIGWQIEREEQAKYARVFGGKFDCNQPIEHLKAQVWEHQKQRMRVPYFETQYDSPYMCNHHLYRNREQRLEFRPKQTHEANPSGREW